MGDSGFFFILLAAWLVLGVLRAASKGQSRNRPRTPPRRPADPRPGAPTSRDEFASLRDLLEQARRDAEGRDDRALAAAEGSHASLEDAGADEAAERRLHPLETTPIGPAQRARREVTRSGAPAAARRMAEPPDHTAVRQRLSLSEAQRAVVWAEILRRPDGPGPA